MKTLIDEMHLHINDIEEDELTQHKKREKKLIATLEHAMDGMKMYKGRARGVVKLVQVLSSKNPYARYFDRWLHNVRSFTVANKAMKHAGTKGTCNLISVILRARGTLCKHRRFLRWKYMTAEKSHELEKKKVKFSLSLRRFSSIFIKLNAKMKRRGFSRWKTYSLSNTIRYERNRFRNFALKSLLLKKSPSKRPVQEEKIGDVRLEKVCCAY
eukprot:g9297.t1